MPQGNENSEAVKPKRSPGAVSHGPQWDGQSFLRRSAWPALLVGRLTAAGGGEAKVVELPEAEQRGARVPLGTCGPPTWAPGLTLLVHAGHWGHTRLRPPRWPALAGGLRQGDVCVPGPPRVLTLPQASPHACLQLCTAPWGSMARGAPGCSESKPLWVQSHLGPRDSAGRQCEVALAQGIVSRNVHSHSIRLLESGSRRVSVGGVAPVGMSLLLFLSLSEQRAALQGVRVCKCESVPVRVLSCVPRCV